MKIYKKGSLCVLLLMAFNSLFAQQANITQSRVSLENDSVRIALNMDVSSFFISSNEAVIFTPTLKEGNHELNLPPVIVSGKKQMILYRREQSFKLGEKEKPYAVLLRNKDKYARPVEYKVNIPYASWMNNATLSLKSEYRDCCTKQYLSLVTIIPTIDLKKPSAPIIADTVYKIEEPIIKKKEQPTPKIATGIDTIRIDYSRGRFDVTVYNKPLLSSVIREQWANIESISIESYASPEGLYGENEKLARQRAENVRSYICNECGVSSRIVKTQWVAENWNGLVELLKSSDEYYKDGAINLINSYDIFSGRKRQLMDYKGGVPYREIVRDLCPQLRYTIIQIKYHSK